VSRFRFVHVGVAAALAAATVTGLGLVRDAAASGQGAPSVLVPIVPCRLADTRSGADNVGTRSTPIGAAETVAFAVWGSNGNCGIAASATAIVTNVTAVHPTADSFITVFPADASPRPTASNLNVTSSSPPTPNQVTVGLSATGAVAVYNNGGSIDIVIDIVGYYEPAGAGGTGPTGAVGPPGAQGLPGPAGATCPIDGCTLVFSGQSTVTNSAANTLDGGGGCRTMQPGTAAYLNIPLPIGAKVTAVSVMYNDENLGSINFDYYIVLVPGNIESNPTQTSLTTVDNSLIGALVFTSTPPPVGLNAVPYIQALSFQVVQKWCGAVVTYTM